MVTEREGSTAGVKDTVRILILSFGDGGKQALSRALSRDRLGQRAIPFLLFGQRGCAARRGLNPGRQPHGVPSLFSLDIVWPMDSNVGHSQLQDDYKLSAGMFEGDATNRFLPSVWIRSRSAVQGSGCSANCLVSFFSLDLL